MRPLLLLIASALLAGSATIQTLAAQTTADYLKLRNEQHIVQPTSGQKLDQIVGPSVVEVQGVVQGFLGAGKLTSLIVKRDDNDNLIVQCQGDPPEWLGNGEVPARLLVRVYRGSKFDELAAVLLCAAREDDIAKIDAAYWRSEAAKAKVEKQAAATRKSYDSASRGSEPEMVGWIGRGHRESAAGLSANRIQVAYRDFVLERNHSLSLKTADQIAQSVIEFSNLYGVDARLVMAVIICESDFRPMSTSHSGAMGLGQLMPGTALWMGVHNPYDLRDNLYGMIKLLRTHMDQFHVDTYPFGSEGYSQALQKVLGAYNAGEGAVRRYGGVPPYRETQAYVRNVINTYLQLRRDD